MESGQRVRGVSHEKTVLALVYAIISTALKDQSRLATTDPRSLLPTDINPPE